MAGSTSSSVTYASIPIPQKMATLEKMSTDGNFSGAVTTISNASPILTSANFLNQVRLSLGRRSMASLIPMSDENKFCSIRHLRGAWVGIIHSRFRPFAGFRCAISKQRPDIVHTVRRHKCLHVVRL
jgi:hypothetical protein